jgi:hypothetical protein
MSDGPIPLLGVPALPSGYRYAVDDGQFGLLGVRSQVRVRIMRGILVVASGYAPGRLDRASADRAVVKASQRAYEQFKDYHREQGRRDRFAHGIRALGMSVAV